MELSWLARLAFWHPRKLTTKPSSSRWTCVLDPNPCTACSGPAAPLKWEASKFQLANGWHQKTFFLLGRWSASSHPTVEYQSASGCLRSHAFGPKDHCGTNEEPFLNSGETLLTNEAVLLSPTSGSLHGVLFSFVLNFIPYGPLTAGRRCSGHTAVTRVRSTGRFHPCSA